MNKCSLQSSGERMYAAEFVVTHFGHGKTPEEIGLMGTPGCASIVSPEAAQGRPLSQGDVVAVMCTAEGVASVRRMGFLRVTPLGAECHKVLSAGGGRRRRCLVEAVVSPTSPLIGCLPVRFPPLETTPLLRSAKYPVVCPCRFGIASAKADSQALD